MRFVLLLGCFFSCSLFANIDCTFKNCMIVVDSGSTGSRAYLYQYKFSSNNTPTMIKELSSKKVSSGLATIGEDELRLNTYLSALFDGFKGLKVRLPVYYHSTAGMRLLSEYKQKSIYHLVRLWFEKNSDAFELKALGTISGQQEGFFGWLAVNYLAGSFTSSSAKQSVGMMDFGGASIQIAMPITDVSQVDKKDVISTMVAGKTYNVYSKSFLGLGINELPHQFLNDKNCFSDSYPLPDGGIGAGNVYQCEQDIELLTNQLHKVNNIQFNKLSQNVDKWYALGALEGLSESAPYQSLGTSFTLNDITQLAQKGACNIDWQVLKKSDPNNKYLYKSCLAGAYYYAIIVNGYGLSESTLVETKASNDATLFDWTYGVVINNHS